MEITPEMSAVLDRDYDAPPRYERVDIDRAENRK
jgi:hypothetical protein